MTHERFYVALIVYNYDASPRLQRIQRTCKSEEGARRLATRLGKLMGTKASDNRTGDWLDDVFGIYGFVDGIEGIYKEITTKIG